jgi:hypothetical protein
VTLWQNSVVISKILTLPQNVNQALIFFFCGKVPGNLENVPFTTTPKEIIEVT